MQGTDTTAGIARRLSNKQCKHSDCAVFTDPFLYQNYQNFRLQVLRRIQRGGDQYEFNLKV